MHLLGQPNIFLAQAPQLLYDALQIMHQACPGWFAADRALGLQNCADAAGNDWRRFDAAARLLRPDLKMDEMVRPRGRRQRTARRTHRRRLSHAAGGGEQVTEWRAGRLAGLSGGDSHRP